MSLKAKFTAAAIGITATPTAVAMYAGYSLGNAALIGVGTTLVTAFGLAGGAVIGAIAISSLFNTFERIETKITKQEPCPASPGAGDFGILIGGVLGAAAGVIAGSMMGYSVMTNNIDDNNIDKTLTKPAIVEQGSKPAGYVLPAHIKLG